MVRIGIEYLGDFRCKATHEPSGATLETAAPLDNGGKGDGFSPTDLAATSLGTCIATVLGLYASRNGLDLTGMKVGVEKEMTSAGPRRIARLDVEVRLPLRRREPHATALEQAAAGCPVHRSLGGQVEKRIRFVWLG